MLFDGQTSKAGFTLLEMILVLAVLSLGFIPLINLFSNGVTASSDATNSSIAVQLAQQKMEQIKALQYADMETTSEAYGQISGYPAFSRAAAVVTEGGSAALSRVTVSVEWTSGSTVNNYVIETLVTDY